MACRIVERTTFNKENVVIKRVPYFEHANSLIFPSPIDFTEEELYTILSKCTPIEKQTISQQYNEILIWNESKNEEYNLLAPIITIKTEKNNLPLLYFPYFIPLMSDEKVWKYTDQELLILTGIRATGFGISEEEILTFFSKLPSFCEKYDLREDDLFFNPSNIGWNPNYGLRIIDYGLKEDIKLGGIYGKCKMS